MSTENDVASQNASLDQPFKLPSELPSATDLTFHLKDTHAAAWPLDEDPAYEQIFESIARILHRRQGHHLMLVGERGVGASSLVAELARRGIANRIPLLEGKHVVSVDCRFVAPEESRGFLAGILHFTSGRRDLVIAIEGCSKLLRGPGGSTNKSLLLSALSRARCCLIGLLEPRDYEELIADDADLREFCQRVEILEPNIETATRLMKHYADGLSQQYQVHIDPIAVERSVVLSANYIFNERLPGKAVKILHRVCEDLDYQRTQHGSSRDTVTENDVIAAVSETTGVPPETLRGIAGKSDYVRSLGEVVVGQDAAVREVATELGLIKAGLTDDNKPASVILFVGQTGTGKTEMAKALARLYSTSKRLKTYTLGNYVESHSVAGIIGVPAGYVGHDSGGQLVNDLNADPYGIFLLDEADKAHPDVLQPFLNLFDEGWVLDQRGVKAYAQHAIFILTTNVGQKMIADMAAKGNSREEIAARVKEAMSQIKHGKSNRPVFAPEFLARIKRVVVFEPLTHEAMNGISRNLMRQMQKTWQEKRAKRLDISDSLLKLIAQASYNQNEKSKGKEGGRIVRKLISDLVEAPLQQAIAERTDEYIRSETVIIDLPSTEGNGSTYHEAVVKFA